MKKLTASEHAILKRQLNQNSIKKVSEFGNKRSVRTLKLVRKSKNFEEYQAMVAKNHPKKTQTTLHEAMKRPSPIYPRAFEPRKSEYDSRKQLEEVVLTGVKITLQHLDEWVESGLRQLSFISFALFGILIMLGFIAFK